MYEELIKALHGWNVYGQHSGRCNCELTAADAIESLAAQVSALQAENAELRAALARVGAERDAAVELLRRLPESCCGCKYAVDGEACQCSECDDADTENCTEECPWWGDPCGLCDDKDSWSFCGAQGEG